jgi:hypothetical protein
MGISRDEGVVGESAIRHGIFYNEKIIPQDGMRAKSDVSRGLVDIQPDLRFEPLTLCVNKADLCHRRATDVRCQCSEVIERWLRSGIQYVIAVKRF